MIANVYAILRFICEILPYSWYATQKTYETKRLKLFKWKVNARLQTLHLAGKKVKFTEYYKSWLITDWLYRISLFQDFLIDIIGNIKRKGIEIYDSRLIDKWRMCSITRSKLALYAFFLKFEVVWDYSEKGSQRLIIKI